MESTATTPSPQDELFGHPQGLYVLFFTEMWERFSYYGMRALLVLFLVSTHHGGPGWTQQEALAFYGTYTMMVYVMGVPGGWLADRFLGRRLSVLYGGLLLCCGHGIMALEGMSAFYTGVVLIVLGVGLLKPNISTMVGELYPAGDVRRDKGFIIFYMGINLGSLLASIIVGYVGEVYGWHYGFGLAGIGMVLGQLQYVMGLKHLRHVGHSTKVLDQQTPAKPLTSIEKDRIKVLLLSFFIVVVFWGAFEQAGGLLNLYTKSKINRVVAGFEIPTTWFQSLNAGFILLFGPLVAGYWAKRAKSRKEASSLFKMGLGTAIMGAGFLLMSAAATEVQVDAAGTITHKGAIYWLVGAYLLHTIGELCASPVALSFITKLAPVRYASLMMGLYFATTGLGNKVAGLLGESASAYGELAIFTGIGVFCILFGLGVVALLKPLKRLTHGAEDLKDEGSREATA